MSDVIWKDIDGQLKAVTIDEYGTETPATWCPQPGSQEAFLTCPIFEVMYSGERGPGKTDALLMDYAQHVEQGWGEEWVGLLFRKTFPQLEDVINKSRKWFPKIFGDRAVYNRAKHFWEWPATGEKLYFRPFEKPSDYDDYHGHAYPWIGWEELTTWPDDKCYKIMISCSRSPQKGMPRKYRSTTNPYGVGHNWVKKRFKLPMEKNAMFGKILDFEVTDEDREAMTPVQLEDLKDMKRVAIRGRLQENKILLHAEPNYVTKIRAAAKNPAQLAAWLNDDWDVTSGGMFDDLWDTDVHVVPDIHASQIPSSWKINRAYDHGQSRPFSVGIWAVSSGEPIVIGDYKIGAVRGDEVRIFEWYGCSSTPNEGLNMSARDIARGIISKENAWGLAGRVRRGPADSSIFDKYEGMKSVAGDMKAEGIQWLIADKGPGSRKQGWQKIRDLLTQAKPYQDGTRDKPGLFICHRCDQFRDTVPGLPRDDKDLDDVDTDAEDHIGDETRYQLRRKSIQVKAGEF